MKKFNKFDDKFNIIGSQIKAIRKQEKITQEDLCARMQVMGLVEVIFPKLRIVINLLQILKF